MKRGLGLLITGLCVGTSVLAPRALFAKTLEELLVEKGVIQKSEAAQVTETGPTKVYWKNGTKVEFPDGNSLNLQTLVQPRYAFTNNDEKAGKHNTSSFSMRRARLYANGLVMEKQFKYELMTDFAGKSDADGTVSPELQDAAVTWMPMAGVEAKMGQYLMPVGRESYASPAKLQFPDYSAATNYFSAFRQQAAAVQYTTPDNFARIGAVAWNGSSDGEGKNKPGVDTRHTGGVYGRINPLGPIDVLEEGDYAISKDLGVSAGAAYVYGSALNVIDTATVTQDVGTANVDLNMKYQGIGIHGELFVQDASSDDLATGDPMGGYIQAGYYFLPKEMEIAGRWVFIDCDDGQAAGTCKGKDSINEAQAAFNYLIWGHNLKAQLMYGYRTDDVLSARETSSSKWVFQLSSFF